MTAEPARTPTQVTADVRPGRGGLALYYWLPTVLYVILIFLVSSKPYLKPPLHFTYADKLAHVCEYGVLGVLLSRALRATAPGRGNASVATWVILGGSLVGASDEWFQSFIPGRDSSVFDLAADAVGLVLAQWTPRWMRPE